MDNKMTHQNTLLTQTKMCPKGFDNEHILPLLIWVGCEEEKESTIIEEDALNLAHW